MLRIFFLLFLICLSTNVHAAYILIFHSPQTGSPLVGHIELTQTIEVVNPAILLPELHVWVACSPFSELAAFATVGGA